MEVDSPHIFKHRLEVMKSPPVERAVIAVVGECLAGSRQATAYLSSRLTVKATRQRPPDGRCRQTTLLVSIGTPNFLERRFVKACLRSGEPFPVKRIQLKRYPS